MMVYLSYINKPTLKQAQEKGFISGFQVTVVGKLISHLHFTIDALIFVDADIL